MERSQFSAGDPRPLEIDAYIILGKSIKEIAEAEGVHEESIRQSIKRGLERMKKTFLIFSS